MENLNDALFVQGSGLMRSSEIEAPSLHILRYLSHGESSAGPRKPTIAERVLALLGQTAQWTKRWMRPGGQIVNITKAISEGTYHLSAAEVSRRIIDHVDEP
jgi:hypothetical protein